ncbi:Golgi membrane exchange factor (Ric1p-Rgp1p) subunit [Coemansia javaensis]|uniref:Golgi membrane exchange factor (Ric1p-Rgp1p) subunit n=1 Tax=Coemansia javaensis TaxID=2761396 RepID=A0A9W8HI09_9FUNG|nr:Golgi membrane exchange factor (Ric1p-Rgp1p) subunit [Coemansia javaensis]
MVLTITATFEKQGTYFAGDTLECHIRFANVHSMPGPGGRQGSPLPHAPGRGGGMAPFLGLDDASEYSGGSALAPGGSEAPRRQSRAYSRHGGGLAVFPAGGGSPSSGGGGGSGGGGRRAADERRDGQQPRRGAASRNASVGNGHHPLAGSRKASVSYGAQFPRLSTSSVLSTPAAALASWLPFGGRQQAPPQPQNEHSGEAPRRPPSDAGGGSLLGSLWRSISGGSDAASRGGAPDGGTERLAIGLAEASGALVLAAPYIRPDQMALLLKHGGTGAGPGPGARSPPVGGGLSGRGAPTSPRPGPGARTQRAIPLLAAAPAILFSELALAPGEAQTFSVRMQLPRTLPPSFRGRVASISYDLVVVAKRDMLDADAHVVHIPFRVMGHVDASSGSGGSSDCPGDALSFARPAQMPPGHVQLITRELSPPSTPRSASPPLPAEADAEPPGAPEAADALPGADGTASTELLYERLSGSDFLRRLLRSSEEAPAASPEPEPDLEPDLGPELGPDRAAGSVEDEVRRSVMRICRRQAPVAFALSQAGRAVASAWLPRRAYQLGDLVVGKIQLRAEAAPVYQVSVWLESVEQVRGRFAAYSAERTEELTRRIHAEHHEFCRGASMLGFSLASQPTAAASFASDIVSNIWQLRIELIVGAGTAAAAAAAAAALPADLGLSAATPFPPTRLHHHHHRQHSSGASPPAPHRAAPGSPTSPPDTWGRSRPRSSTVAATATATAAAAAAAPPPAPQPAAPSPDERPVRGATMRRRYDVAREVPVQTLSCTVGIQMYPSLSGALLLPPPAPGRGDAHTIDLAVRS